jgi:hypothetical protein
VALPLRQAAYALSVRVKMGNTCSPECRLPECIGSPVLVEVQLERSYCFASVYPPRLGLSVAPSSRAVVTHSTVAIVDDLAHRLPLLWHPTARDSSWAFDVP